MTFTPTDTTDFTTATATVSITVTGTTMGGTPSYTWKNVQILAGGYTPGIIMHPAQQGLMYARTDVGGAYRYDSTAKSWVPLTDWISRANSTDVGIESVAIDPSDAQRVYLAGGLYTESWWSQNGAIMSSTDQGATFTTVQMPFKMGSNDNGRAGGERLAVDPNDGAVLFFGSRLNGLWTSHDHGATWSQVTTFPGTVAGSPGTLATTGVGIVFEIFVKGSEAPNTPTQTIYAGVSATGTNGDPQSIYVSKDGGNTWAAVVGAPTGLFVNHGVQSPDGTALYFVYGDAVGPYSLNTGAIKKYTLPTTSAPAGLWADITPPRPTYGGGNPYQGGYGSVAVDPHMPNVIMVSTLDHYYPVGDDLWRSTDGGATWNNIDARASWDGSLSPWIYFHNPPLVGTGNWVTSLTIDPFDSNHVVYGTGQTIWNTNNMTAFDGGATTNWTIDAQGFEETVVLSLISPPSGPANLLSQVGDICGFQHVSLTTSPAAGMMTNPQCTTGTSIDFAQANPLIMARVGSGGSAFGGTSADGGTTWTAFPGKPATANGQGQIAVSEDGKTLVWAPSDAATSWSTDSGATWTASVGAPAQRAPIADRVNPTTFYIYDSNTGLLLESTDKGATFTTLQSGL
ncbi:MAG TPA: sialidase family protein, partial [Chthoniobacterales bacterium]